MLFDAQGASEEFTVLRRILIVAGLVVSLTALPVLAQAVPEGTEIAPDNIKPLEYARPMVEYICAILFLAVAMGIGFMPSKRVKD